MSVGSTAIRIPYIFWSVVTWYGKKCYMGSSVDILCVQTDMVWYITTTTRQQSFQYWFTTIATWFCSEGAGCLIFISNLQRKIVNCKFLEGLTFNFLDSTIYLSSICILFHWKGLLWFRSFTCCSQFGVVWTLIGLYGSPLVKWSRTIDIGKISFTALVTPYQAFLASVTHWSFSNGYMIRQSEVVSCR